MTNVVEITIRADDASAAGFASALAQVEALKKAAQGIGFTFAAPNLSSQLQQIKQKMQAAGLADLIDYNLNQGQIGQQLLMLKRKIGQAGISDMLDINLNQDQITEQLGKLSSDAFNIPVGFDVAAFPKIEEQQAVNVPVNFRIPDNLSLPKLGETVSVPIKFVVPTNLNDLLPKLGETINLNNLENATSEFSKLGIEADALQKSLLGVENLSGLLDAAFAHEASELDSLGMSFSKAAAAAAEMSNRNAIVADMSQLAHDKFNIETQAAEQAAAALDKAWAAAELMNAGTMDLIHSGTGFGIVWRTLTAHVELFGGALTAVGVPSGLAEAGVLHILIDSLIEISAVLVPAAVAFTAFGVAALPVLETTAQRMIALSNVSHGLGQEIYPLSGNFSKMAQAVQPEVYTLFGDALAVAGRSAGTFGKLAVQAGQGVESLSARTAVALTSQGTGAFLASAVDDMVKIGDVFENIFGTFGNILKVMPGYAEDLLSVAVDVSGGIEKITSSGLGSWLIGAGLAFHGAILWLGLGATGAVAFGNALIGLAAKFGLAEEGALAFDAVQFGTGIKMMIPALADLVTDLGLFAGATVIAADASDLFDASLLALGAVNPLVWVGAGVAAVAGLVYWMSKATSATSMYDAAVKASLSGTPITQLDVAITTQQAVTIGRLDDATAKLGSTNKGASTSAADLAEAMTGHMPAYQQQAAVVKGYQQELSTLNTYQGNFNTLLKAAGGNMAAFSQVGITSTQVIGANKQQMAEMVLELQGANDAFKALSLSSNESSAAINAESSIYNTSVIPSLQALGKAESNVIDTIVGGEDSLATYKQYLVGTSGAAKDAGDNFNGMSKSAITLSGDFYGQLIPAAEQLINSLQAQSIGVGDLTKVVATEVSQMSAFANGNAAAKSVLVDLVNNALGPGTVSLQSLNGWVSKNSTTMSGFDSIVAKSTIAAGGLANVLQQDVSAAFAKELLQLTGANSALKTYTQDIINNSTETDKGSSDRAALIADLVKAGLTAKQAATYVDGLSKSVGKIPKNAPSNIAVTAAGAWSIRETDLPGGAAGMVIQGGQHGKDSVHVMGMPGELMIPTWLVNSGMVDHLAGLIPGWNGSGKSGRDVEGQHLASGGIVGISNKGNPAEVGQWIDKAWNATNQTVIDADKSAMIDGINAAIKAAKAKAQAQADAAGPGGGSASANEALAFHLYPSLSASEKTNWNNVSMRESGWNQFADNPTSDAYGIPQALPYTKMPKAAWPASAGGSSNPTAQIEWMYDYVHGRYGSFANAWAHEESAGWYGNGLDAVVNTPTLIGVGERGAEHVQVTPLSQGGGSSGGDNITLEVVSGGQSAFDNFMLEWIRNNVRVKGGGDVQKAFGRG